MQFNALSERYHDAETQWDFRSAQICAVLAEINRNHKKRPKPYTPQDFMPQRRQKRRLTEEQMKQQLEIINMALGGNKVGDTTE